MWSGYRNDGGYGVWNGDLVHRLAYEMFIGSLPDDANVCHTCDNPPCVNPAHLWIGTHADNQADKAAKGRAAPNLGATNPMAKLSDDDVRVIKYGGMTGVEAARTYNVSAQTVCDIRKGRRWTHV